MDQEMLKQKAEEVLEQGKGKAAAILEDGGKMDELLDKLEAKLKEVPQAGVYLAEVPLMISLLKDYVQKDYRNAPLGTMLAIVAAGLYLVSPKDIIPDNVPVLGLVDDAAVITACIALTKSDLTEYSKWKEAKKASGAETAAEPEAPAEA
ncbi:MAG: DUF1232 domain-containing protein [Clostridia bacterium]|nr:DUF1232 domain-containing protein [Clostridia bacterium]